MTFSYMVYMLSTCEGYFSVLLGAMHRESFRLAELHKLSLKDADLHVLSNVSLCSEVASGMTLRSIGDLEVNFPHPELLHAKLYHSRVNSFRVT